MLDKAGVAKADGLDGSEQAEVKLLIERWDKHLVNNGDKMRYYMGEVGAANLGISLTDAMAQMFDLSSAWPEKAVAARKQRSIFDGFVASDGETPELLVRIVRDNELIDKYQRAVADELVHGCIFATVSPGEPDEPEVVVNFHSALSATALWDYRRHRIRAGLAIVSYHEETLTEPEPDIINYYKADSVVRLVRDGRAWKVDERLPNKAGRPLMEPMCHAPTEFRPFGRSVINRNVRNTTKKALREALRTEAQAELFSSVQRWLIDATDEQAKEMSENKLKALMGGLMILTQDKRTGKTPQLGQFSMPSFEPHIAYMRQLASEFSMESNVPLSELGVTYDNPTSEGAIYATKESLVVAVEQDLNLPNKRSLRNIALLCMAMAQNKSLAELTDEERSVMAHFKDPATPSVVSQADAATKIAAPDEGFAGTDVYYEMFGLDQSDISRINAQKRRAAGDKAIAAIFGGGDANTPQVDQGV